jgi:hypothetical protein
MHPIESEELMAYLDGELPQQRASEAAQHLSDCRECQAVAADMQRVSRKLVEWQIEEPSPSVERIVNSAQPPKRVRSAWRRSAPWLAGLAAAGIAMVLLVPSNQHANRMRAVPAVSVAVEPRLLRDYGTRLKAELKEEARPSLPDTNFSAFSTVPAAQTMAQGVVTAAEQPRIGDTLVIRTAQITLITGDFAKVRATLEDILKRHGGHVGNLTIAAPADSGQTLQATLRVPASQLDAAMAEIRRLGRVENEQQGGEEATQQMVDLEARLTNARNTERRLSDILNRTTGKIADVLAVENEIDRVRGEIERMEAERKNLGDRISFATLDVRVNEEYKAHLAVAAPSTFGLLRNAAVDGYRNVADSLTNVVTFLLSYGPVLVVWMALLFFPVRYAWQRLRKVRTHKLTEEHR